MFLQCTKIIDNLRTMCRSRSNTQGQVKYLPTNFGSEVGTGCSPTNGSLHRIRTAVENESREENTIENTLRAIAFAQKFVFGA